MLQLESSEGDLSRRLTMYEMRGLSVREFLEYEGILQIPSVSLDQLLADHVSIAMEVCGKIKILEQFKKYLEVGYYPFYKTVHHGYYQRLQNVVNQVIEVDYPNIEDITMSAIRKTTKSLTVLAEGVRERPKVHVL